MSGRWRVTCWNCGGEGTLEGTCDCMNDPCVCRNPHELKCGICNGEGYIVTQLTDDNYEDAIPVP